MDGEGRLVRLVRVGQRPALEDVGLQQGQRAVPLGAPRLAVTGRGTPLARAIERSLPEGCSLAVLGTPAGASVPVVPVSLEWARNAEVVDVLALARPRRGDPAVLLITRGHQPYEGMLALPGGFVDRGEPPLAAALRELAEETGLAPVPLDGDRRPFPPGGIARLASIEGAPSLSVALSRRGPAAGSLALDRVADGWDDPRFDRGVVHTYLFVLELSVPARTLAGLVCAGDDAGAVHLVPVPRLGRAPIGFAHHVVLIDRALAARGVQVAWEGANRARLEEAVGRARG